MHNSTDTGEDVLVGLPGPKMTAFQSMMLSEHGAPEMPPGGSLWRRLKSFIRRRREGVDIGVVCVLCYVVE